MLCVIGVIGLGKAVGVEYQRSRKRIENKKMKSSFMSSKKI